MEGKACAIGSLQLLMQHGVEHVQQSFSWDCGLACIQMILRHLDDEMYMLNNYEQICQDGKFGQSTWTIDLCYVLKRLKVPHQYYTTTWGINPQHVTETFYSTSLKKDAQRIMDCFKNAAELGINITQRKLPLQDVLDHLVGSGLAIVLTNARLLFCNQCQTLPALSSKMQSFLTKLPYQGHYIVVCGYDLDQKKIYYRNPSTKSCLCAMTFKEFQNAREASGTDDDIILIFPKVAASEGT